jgi:uncharacterized protein YhfF
MLGFDTPEIDEFWKDACSSLGIDENTPHCAYTFAEPNGDPKITLEIDDIAALALAGLKRGTAHLELQFEKDDIPLREVGDYWIVLKCDGTPVCVITLIGTNILPFNQVGPVFAASEGPELGLIPSLENWRNGHKEYFIEQCARWGVTFKEDLSVVCESFIKVYPHR